MNPDAKEKLKALQLTIDKLEKTYGKGTVMKLSDEKIMDVPAISTGSLGLDIALGIGGIPRGRVTEIYGLSRPEKQHLPCTVLHKRKRKAALLLSLMLNMHLIKRMRRNWASIRKTC